MEIFAVITLCAVVAGAIRMIYDKHVEKKSAKERELPDLDCVDSGADSAWDTSIKEIVLDDLLEQDVDYIKNPLPVPKRRKHKAMDYALDLKGNDDFDLKDLGGKDFYDIE